MRSTRFIPTILAFIFCYTDLCAQSDTAIHIYDTVIIDAYQGKKILKTAAAINFISSEDLARFNNTNALQALNATPGVRMEERSPGSYRLNIRGSSVRSPFGVRNVKIYYGDVPFTAPGGASMLNMLGYYNIGSVEIIKGPGGSMYGAGTGGVLLIQPLAIAEKITAGVTGGSYGLFAANVSASLKKNTIRYERLQSDGFRNHTAMRRNNFSWSGLLSRSEKSSLKANLIYSNLQYETPGALNLNEFNANPRAARPATPTFPGAEQAKAGIEQENVLLSLSHTYIFSSSFRNTTAIYGSFNQVKNPTVQNYERKKEPHFGGRTIFQDRFVKGRSLFDWAAGAEFQKGIFRYKTYKNVNGKPDSLRVEDELDIQQLMGFAQLSITRNKWIVTAGASINRLTFNFNRLSTTPAIDEDKKFIGEIVPRFALLYKINENMSAYVNVAKGFSPPAADEIFADNNSYNLALAAEKGWNYEPGLKGNLFNDRFGFDLSYFTTGLSNSIVTRRDAGGGNYYVNAGKTSQQGFEMALRYHLVNKEFAYLYGTKLAATYSHYRFRYKQFEQAGNNYSGNDMPGVSPNNVNILFDLQAKPGYYLNLTYTYTDKIQLNDANSLAAGSYHLLAAKAGIKKQFEKIVLSFFAGADNITDERYSLGNDINGFGGRYFNVAAGRSFYAGATISL